MDCVNGGEAGAKGTESSGADCFSLGTVGSDVEIVLTGYGTLELEEKAFEEGAHAVILKPVDVDVLLSVVTHAIIRRELHQAGPSDPMSTLSIDAYTITMESKRMSSRLRDIDERLRRQIEDAEK